MNEPDSLPGVGGIGNPDKFRPSVMKMLSNLGPSRVQEACKRKALIIRRREGMLLTTDRVTASFIPVPVELSALTNRVVQCNGYNGTGKPVGRKRVQYLW